jgi:hypothetical protein
MSRGLAPGPRAGHLVAAARGRGGGRGGGGDGVRLHARPAPLRIPARASYSKDDVFGLCEILARAERALIRSGEPDEAARVATAFEVLESGLARRHRLRVSPRTPRTRSQGS